VKLNEGDLVRKGYKKMAVINFSPVKIVAARLLF